MLLKLIKKMNDDGFQRRWYEIRDTLVGRNYKQKDSKKALILAFAFPEHPEACWLVSVPGFQFSQGTDARSLCFEGLFQGDSNLVRQSASMGYAFAQALLADWLIDKTESIDWAQKAANQGERDGFKVLGDRLGCLKSMQRAYELGSLSSMVRYANVIRSVQPLKCLELLGKAALSGHDQPFLFYSQQFIRNTEPKSVMLIASVLKGHCSVTPGKKNMIFKMPVSKTGMDLFKMALDFYENRLVDVRLAVDAWTIVAKRMGIIKDMRKYIGIMVWNKRKGKWNSQ